MKTFREILKVTIFLSTTLLMGIQSTSAKDFVNSVNSDGDSLTYKGKKKNKVKRAVASEKAEVETPAEVVVVNPEPAQLVKEETVVEEKPVYNNYCQFTIAFIPSFMTVKGTQLSNSSQGELNSNMFVSYQAEYFQQYHNWNFGLGATYGQIKFENSDDHVLGNETQNHLDLDLFASRVFGRFSLGLGIGQDNKIFYKAMNSTYVEIERRTVQRYYLQAAYELYKGSENKISISGKLGINPSEDTETYNVEDGKLYSVQAKWIRTYSPDKTIGINFYYDNDDYKTNKLDLNSTEVGVGVSFGFDWGTGQ